MDASPILQYFESKPYRRRVFMLQRSNGQEYAFDTDGDSKPEYAPFTFSGITQSGSKYPPVVGNDGVLYTNIDLVATSDVWTPSSALSGWKVGTKYISQVMDLASMGGQTSKAADEPFAYSIGGKLAYWVICCDRGGGSFDLSIPLGRTGRSWGYWGYGGRFSMFPGYQDGLYFGEDGDPNGWGYFGGDDGVYGKHGTVQNPWIPYKGKLYRHMGNSVIALSPTGGARSPLPMARTVQVEDTVPMVTPDRLKASLEEEIQKMIDAGHLKPGLFKSNIGDFALNGNGRGPELDQGVFYFSNPGDTIYALVRALPYLSAEMQQKTRDYIRNEMVGYPIDTYAYVGFLDGKPRQAAVIPPEYESRFRTTKQTNVVNNRPWYFPMTHFYAAWKFAQIWPEEAARLYSNLRNKLTLPCMLSDSQLLEDAQMLNAYLAGYLGYLELEKMAGNPESSAVRSEYSRLLRLRVDNFTIDVPWEGHVEGGFDYAKNFATARHFLYLVPEVAKELRDKKLSAVEEALDQINRVTPYWFVEGYDATNAEGTHQQLYDVATLNAYAMILEAPYEVLLKYLDAPVFMVGDLFYIQNLVSALHAAPIGPFPIFTDVPFSHPYNAEIEALYQAGYTAGCSTNPLMYCPEATMNRAESSVFVERGIHTASYDPPTPTSQVFADLPLDSWAAKWVNGLWQDQYTAGCGTNPLVYCPWQGHTRAEGCVFYMRMLNGATYEPPQPAQQTFGDVPLSTWYAKWVQAAYDAGLLTACQTSPELRFCPEGPLTRALAAYMMVQAKGLRGP
jgi:hypothetical protein